MRVGVNGRYLYDPSLRGFNRYTSCLLRALQTTPGLELYVLSEERFPVHEAHRAGVRAEVLNLPASRTFLWEQWVLPLQIRKLKLDVFHAPSDGRLPFRKVCPYVVTYHGVPDRSLAQQLSSGVLDGRLADYLDAGSHRAPRLAGLYSRILSRSYLRVADLVITVSEFSKQELVRFLAISPDKVRVIYEAAAEIFSQILPLEFIEKVRVSYQIPARFVLFVGGFEKRKNLSTLLRAFARLKKTLPDVGLVLVGVGGNVDACRVLSTGLGLVEGQQVFFLRQIPDLELAALYRGASLFTTLSWHEGFCLPLVEAMTAGTPIVASSFGAIPEILGDGGILVDPRYLERVVDTMQEILCHPVLANSLRSSAIQRSKEFSWQQTAQQTMRVYRELL